MAESLVGKIVGNAGKQWSRNTVADGNWLNTNTVQKLNQNDKTLAEAIESVSAAMEHFTPEITPSAWPCAANKTIQNIEQNADGSLNVTYQPIESSTTSDDSLWTLFKQNAYDSVKAVYTETENDINHEAGALSESLIIPPGIYDVKVEVLYQPTKSTINNKLDIAISSSTNVADALYQTFILFDDTLNGDDQSEWITGIIKLEASTALNFLIKGESAQGRYKLNNIYINSIGGAAGPAGPEGPAGPQGPAGPAGASGFSPIITIDDTIEGQHTVSITDATHTDSFIVKDGEDGNNGDSVELESITPIVGGNNITFKWGTNTSGFNVMDGANGDPGENGTSVIVKSIREFNDTVGTHTKGGTEITLEWNEGQTVKTSAFSAFNGEKGQDGSGASYTFDNTTLSGTGAIDDPIGVKTNVIATQAWVEDQGYLTTIPDTYATKDYANAASATALTQAQSWVGQQGYLTSVPDSYATKTYANEASANALSQAQTWVGTQGYLEQSDLNGYATETYADSTSAEALSQAKTWVNQQNFVNKSQLEINANINLIKYTNGNSSSAISAVNYKANLSDSTIVPQRLVVVTGDQEIIDHYGDYSENKYGTIFFVTSAHN